MVIKFPCELVGWFVLPSIRSNLVTYFVSEKKLSRKKTAELLGLTEAAVCQYLKKKRGKSFSFDKQQVNFLRSIADDMLESKNSNKVFLSNTCLFCKDLRRDLSLCNLHDKAGHECSTCSVCGEN
ncbi:MAG: hypothetical protein ABH821_03255 [archaeon]